MKQTLARTENPTPDNSPVTEIAHGVESAEDGVYSVTTQTRHNAAGQLLTSTQKQLISQLSHTLENKSGVCFRFAGLFAELCMHLYSLPR